MKNLWRMIVLFALPGAVAGGWSVIALFRFSDRGGELLENVVMASLLWCSSLALFMYVVRYLRNLPQLYYRGCVIAAAAFAGGLGLIRAFGLPGWYEGLAGIMISGALMPFFVHGFADESFNWRDRWSFIAGAVTAGAWFVVMTGRERLLWQETFFFYLAEALLVFWCFASPLTVFGSWKRRWMTRIAMLAVAIGAFFVSPVLNYLPWNKAPEKHSAGVHQHTYVTPQGSCFVWIDPADNSGFFAPDGRLLSWDECNQNLLPDIPGLLALLPGPGGKVKMVCQVRSLLPDHLRKVPGVQVDCQMLPEALLGCFDLDAAPLYNQLKWQKKNSAVQYDLLFIGALPDNPYPGVIRNFWQQQSAVLKNNGVIAVTANVLQNKEMNRILTDRYTYCGILPAGNDIHIFATENIALTPDALDRELCRKWGKVLAVPGGIYTLICQPSGKQMPVLPDVDCNNVKLGNNHFWRGNWWWWLITAALVIVWRMLRIASERRQQRYRWWKSVENGFAGMGIVLMCTALLVINNGILTLGAAVLALSAVFVLGQVRSGGGWCALAGVIAVLPMAYYSSHCGVLALPIMLQAMLYCGNLQYKYAPDYSLIRRRQLWCAAAIGMWLAAGAMALVWFCNVPWGCAWVLFLLARIPGIWQNGNMRVY